MLKHRNVLQLENIDRANFVEKWPKTDNAFFSLTESFNDHISSRVPSEGKGYWECANNQNNIEYGSHHDKTSLTLRQKWRDC